MMQKIYSIIRDICIKKNSDFCLTISENSSLRRDLNFDSFDLAELTVRIEECFLVDVFEDGIIDTPKEIAEKISKNKIS